MLQSLVMRVLSAVVKTTIDHFLEFFYADNSFSIRE